MSELSSVHKYAAGALFALALNQAQLHQCSLPPRLNAEEAHVTDNTTEIPWSSPDYALVQHVFRYLGIEQKSWVGLETTALSSDAKHHIGAFLRLLSEDDDEPSTSGSLSEDDLAKAVDAMSVKIEESSSASPTKMSSVDKRMSSSDDIDIRSMDVMAESLGDEETGKMLGAKESRLALEADTKAEPRNTDQFEEHGSSFPSSSKVVSTTNAEASIGSFDSTIVTRQRKMAVLYELLVACVADASEEKHAARAGYDARYRVALRLLATWFDVKWTKMAAMEVMVAYMAMAVRKEEEASTAEDEEPRKSTWAKWKRGTIIGAAALTGGTLLAISGGLAAPAIAAGLAAMAPAVGTVVPVIGASGFAAAAAATGSAAGSIAVAASFGAAGASLTGSKMARRIGGIDEFSFEAIGDNHNQGRLAVSIVVSGIILKEEDFTRPWKFPDGDLERYALRWETKVLMAVSTAIQDWLTAAVTNELMKRGAMMTVLSGLLTALAWPSALLSITNFIDSKWAIAVDRSDKAGELLAKCLLNGLQGSRPVTLLGFSLGARVIFACLEHLANAGNGGIVERVVLLGAPVAIDTKRWMTARKVVAGRFVNCYSTNDWILGVIYRASILSQGLAGVQAVDVPGIENVNVTAMISGHSTYLSKIPEILEMVDIDNYFPVFF